MYMRCCNCEKWIETVHIPFDMLNFLNFNINFTLTQKFYHKYLPEYCARHKSREKKWKANVSLKKNDRSWDVKMQERSRRKK